MTHKITKTLLFIVALHIGSICSFAAQSSELDLDSYVARTMKMFEVPGIAVAVVKDGKVVVAKGYGVRKLGNASPVDASTLFSIASNTKVFTAVALGLLVEEGKIGWDKPVVNYLPWFAMWDPWVTRELTVRDLLVHRSGLGLGAGDLLWWPPSRYDRKEIARRIRYIKPATSFRSAYAYDNVLYLVAGEVIEAASGQSWEEFVTTRILKKVGMTNTVMIRSDRGLPKNVATPHARVDGAVREVKPFLKDTTNPAAGIYSCAEDMAKWMRVLLSEGKLSDGSQLFKTETWQALSHIVTPIPMPNYPPELKELQPNSIGYGLGLVIQDYRGHKVITHTGGMPGYLSRVYLIPDQSLGITVLTNQESGFAFNSITYYVVDKYLNAPVTDWNEVFKKVEKNEQSKNQEALKTAQASRNKSSQPSLPLKDYVQTYEDDWYGKISIALENKKLVLRSDVTPSFIGDLEHWQYDTFVVHWRDPELRADAFITFALTPEGKIDHATMKAFSPETDFSFDFQDLYLKPIASITKGS